MKSDCCEKKFVFFNKKFSKRRDEKLSEKHPVLELIIAVENHKSVIIK